MLLSWAKRHACVAVALRTLPRIVHHETIMKTPFRHIETCYPRTRKPSEAGGNNSWPIFLTKFLINIGR